MTAFGNLVCGCGKEYAPTSDGRWIHRELFDHTPCIAPVDKPCTEGISPACRINRHDKCGGGFVQARHGMFCTCACGHPERGAIGESAGQAYNRTVDRTAPEDACDVNEGLTRSSGTSREGLGSW